MMDKINIMLNNIKNNETKTYRQPIYFNGSEDKFVKSETSEVEKKKMQLISNLINSYKDYEYVVKDLIKEEPWYIGDYCSIAYDFKDGRPIRITAKEYDEDEDETNKKEYSFEEFLRIMRAVANKAIKETPEEKDKYDKLYAQLEIKLFELIKAAQE